MSFKRSAIFAVLPLVSLLSGCSGLGGPYLPSEQAEKIASMDVPGELSAKVEMPLPLTSNDIAKFPKGALSGYVAKTLADNPIVRQGYFGILSGVAQGDQYAAQRGLSIGIDSHYGGTDNTGQEPIRQDRALGAYGSLTIFDGGAGRFREQSARWSAVAAAASAEDRIESVAFAVTDAYVSILKAREVLKLSDSEVARFGMLLRQVQQMVLAGGASVADIPEAEARVERIKQQRVQAEQSVADAEAKFRRITGSPPPDVFSMLPPPDIDVPPLDVAVSQSVEHPAVRSYDAQVRAAIKATLSVDAERYGTLIAQFGPSGFAQIFGGHNVTDLGNAFLHFTLPVIDNGEHSAKLRKSVADLEVAIAQRDDAVRAIEFAVRQAYNARNAAIQQAALAIKEREASERLSRAKLADYTAGSVDLRSVLDAEEAVASTRIKSAGAVWDKLLSSYRLMSASGKLAVNLRAVSHQDVDLTAPDNSYAQPSLLKEPDPVHCSFDGDDTGCSFDAAEKAKKKNISSSTKK